MPDLMVRGLPGISAAKTAAHRVILRQGDYTFLAQGKVIDGSASRDPGNSGDVDVLRPGVLMGRKTTSPYKYAPSILGVTSNAEAVGSTAIEAPAAVVTELVRRIGSTGTFKLTGPPVAGGVVVTETVTYSAAFGTTITCTAIANAFIAGSFIQPTDGSEIPLTFIPDGWGIKVTDVDGSNIDEQFPQVPVAGVINASQLVNWPSDVSLQAWIVARLNGPSGGQFVFDHPYGG